MTNEELKAAETELAAEMEAARELAGGDLFLIKSMTPEGEARRLFFELYVQACDCRLARQCEAESFVECCLKALREEKLSDADIRAIRKKHKAANEYRATLEEEARAQGGGAAQIICEILPSWLALLDAALAKELSERRKQAKLAKIEAAKERLIDANPYDGQFREQYSKRETRARYLPMPQNKAILEYLLTPCTERNCEQHEKGTLVKAQRGYSYLVLTDGRRDEKTGELIEMTRSNAFTAACTLIQLLLQVPRQGGLDPSYPKLVLDLYEMMALRGLKDEQNARAQIARDLQMLQCTTIPATNERLLGRHYSILQERNVPARGSKIEAVFGRSFFEELIPWLDNMMPLPLGLLEMNAEYDGLALICGMQLAFCQFYNYGEEAAARGVKGSEIARRAECLLPSESDSRGRGKNYSRVRIDPIFKAIDRLNRNMSGAALNVGMRRLPGCDGYMARAKRTDDFNAICLNAAKWEFYPDVTAQRAEAKKARGKRAGRKQGQKKA